MRAIVSSLAMRIAAAPAKAVSPFAPDRASVVLLFTDRAVMVKSLALLAALLANDAPFSTEATVRTSCTLRAKEIPTPRLFP